jgi:hypothetical protein
MNKLNNCIGCYSNKLIRCYCDNLRGCPCQNCLVKVTCRTSNCEKYEKHVSNVDKKLDYKRRSWTRLSHPHQ